MTGKLKTRGNMMLATKLDGVLNVSVVYTYPSKITLIQRQ